MKFIIAFVMVLGSGFSAVAGGSDWRPGSADVYSAFRSNAPHFWGWLKTQNSSVLNPSGVVVGDAHILNFGDVQLQGGGRELSLVDIDDGGQGSLVGDFVRFAVGNQLSPFQVSMDDLIQSYSYGLSGVEAKKPKVLKDVESLSDADFQKKQDKYIDKMTSHDRFNEKAGVADVATAPADILNLYQASKNYFFAAMPGYHIYDLGYKVKESGGSQGLVRFWFLIGKSDDRHIIEFKLETDPAVAEFANQLSQTQRFNQVAAIYRPSQPAYGPYKFVDTGSAVFLMRARISAFLDFDPLKNTASEDIQNGQQMSLYLANKMGLWQHQQGLSANILGGSAKGDVKTLTQSYQNLVLSLSR
ncbi:MAG: DUF2252 family protein [Bdellovibrio sp.]